MRNPYLQSGVTLVELVIVMIVIGILSVPLMNGFTISTRSLSLNDEIQTATMLAQQCAETILAKRRDTAYGYPAITSDFQTWCTSVEPGYASYSRTVVADTAPYTPGNPPCPSVTTECASVEITVSVGGEARANINMLMVK